jgi:DNA-binding GntR family transcriptional regulator
MTKIAESATQRAYNFIRDRLQNRELQPGSRLVTRNLAKKLGTSLNPVREALNRLSSQGLVEHVPGSGTFVHEPNAQGIRDLYGVREAIESHAAAEAASEISAPELATLKQICEGWGRLATRLREHSQAKLGPEELAPWANREEQFHNTLVNAGRNRMLSRIVTEQRVLSSMFKSHCAMEFEVTVETVEHVFETHSELVKAIENHEPDRARKLMGAMLLYGRDQVLAHMENLRC